MAIQVPCEYRENCQDHTGEVESRRGLDKQFRLLLWGIGGACAVIIGIQSVMFSKLTNVETLTFAGKLDAVRLESRITAIEGTLNDMTRHVRTDTIP